jgi:Zn-dependent M28 family amino/carboxypeptidase
MRALLWGVLWMGCSPGSMDVQPQEEPPVEEDTGEEDTGEVDPFAPELVRERVLGHLQALQQIADDHEGHRSAGSTGYDASTEYVWDTLSSFGLEPVRHAFEVRKYEPVGAALDVSGLTLQEDEDYTLMWYSPGGSVQAPVHSVDLMLPPGPDANSSTSGCEAEDFEGFPKGHIALIQRGSCTYEQKASHAADAGASGVIVFNEGQTGRKGLVGGALSQSHSGSIPVVFTTFSLGEALAVFTEPVQLITDAETTTISQDNVLATRPGTSGKRWIFGAHLDSVPEGPGINDNGTGVAVILEMGRMIAGLESDDAVTVAFWGAEELGLIGSLAYAESLSEAEVEAISGYLNLDMVGSPNPGRFLYAGDTAVAADAPGTMAIEMALSSWFDREGMGWKHTSVNGRSDHAGFVYRGVPSGGFFTGAEQVMTASEAEEWGGMANQPYDPCYHQQCDQLENVNMEMLVEMAQATQNTLTDLLYSSMQSSTYQGPYSPSLNTSASCAHKEHQ